MLARSGDAGCGLGLERLTFFVEDDMTDICSIPIKSRLKVRTAIKSGGITAQHSRRVLKVTSGLKSGGIDPNHNPIARALAAVLKKADRIRRGLGK